jgi:hypothetical protein
MATAVRQSGVAGRRMGARVGDGLGGKVEGNERTATCEEIFIYLFSNENGPEERTDILSTALTLK